MFENTKKMVVAGFCASSIYNSINAKCCCSKGNENNNNNNNNDQKPSEYDFTPEGLQKLVEDQDNFPPLTQEAKTGNKAGKALCDIFNCFINNTLDKLNYGSFIICFERISTAKVAKFIVKRGTKVKLEDTFNADSEDDSVFALELAYVKKDKYILALPGNNPMKKGNILTIKSSTV